MKNEIIMRECLVLDELVSKYQLDLHAVERVINEYGAVMRTACELGQSVEFISKMLYLNWKSSKQKEFVWT